MNAVCVDRDEKTLALAAEVCEAHPLLNEVKQFTCARDCLLWLEGNPVNLAVLEVELADVDGLLLASEIKRKCPTAAIVLVASSDKYALEAFEIHASGYVLKPVGRARLEDEVEYAFTGSVSHTPCHIEVRTFGNFELLVDGRTVSFNRSKAKELLAYLVDKHGSGVTRAEILRAIHNPLGVRTVNGIKVRTRASMGRCQGGYCETRITAMIREELGEDIREVELGPRGSRMFTGTVKGGAEA